MVNELVVFDIIDVQRTPDLWRHTKQWHRDPFLHEEVNVTCPVTRSHRHASCRTWDDGVLIL